MLCCAGEEGICCDRQAVHWYLYTCICALVSALALTICQPTPRASKNPGSTHPERDGVGAARRTYSFPLVGVGVGDVTIFGCRFLFATCGRNVEGKECGIGQQAILKWHEWLAVRARAREFGREFGRQRVWCRSVVASAEVWFFDKV